MRYFAAVPPIFRGLSCGYEMRIVCLVRNSASVWNEKKLRSFWEYHSSAFPVLSICTANSPRITDASKSLAGCLAANIARIAHFGTSLEFLSTYRLHFFSCQLHLFEHKSLRASVASLLKER